MTLLRLGFAGEGAHATKIKKEFSVSIVRCVAASMWLSQAI